MAEGNSAMVRLASKLAQGVIAKSREISNLTLLQLLADPKDMAAVLMAGKRLAKEAVTAIRTAPDYDAAVWGTTDEEIAEKLLAMAEEREKGK